MRRLRLVIGLAISTFCVSTTSYANCIVIDRLDTMHAIQSRLASDPSTALFASDIRQIRIARTGLSDSDALNAVDGNRFTGHGADVVRFLQNTQRLLQGSSMDDPQSVRPHFDNDTRNNLARMATHLAGLRCDAAQIAADAELETVGLSGGTTDEEDLAEVVETLNRLAQEAIRPRSLLTMLLVVTSISLAAPIIRRQLHLRKRRAERHNTTYQTRYICNNSQSDGMLIDINCHGTKLRHEADEPLAKGTAISIFLCENWIEGTVMWSNAHYSGVQFRKDITLSAVDAVRANQAPFKKQNGALRGAA